jgi:hypothetical protein
MRFIFSLLFLLLAGLTNGQGRMELVLLTSPDPTQTLVDSLFKDLLQRGNPKAILFWAEHYALQSESTEAASWMMNEQTTLIVDSTISKQYMGWSILLKSIKKPKQKALALDSLLSLSPQNIEQRIQRIRALTELKFLLVKKRKSLIEEYRVLPQEITPSAYDELRYRVALSDFFKTWKALAEWKENDAAIKSLKESFEKEYQAYLHQMMVVFSTELRGKKTNSVNSPVPEAEVKTGYPVAYYATIAGLGVLSLVLLFLFFSNKKRMKNSSVDFIEFQNREKQWLEKEQLYSEQLDVLKSNLKELDASNNKLNNQLSHYSEIINDCREQMEVLQANTKVQLDDLIKEPGVSQVMNLKNGITRGLMKLKETINK